MKAEIEYLREIKAEAVLEIDDISQCAIEATSFNPETFETYFNYLVIYTIMGESVVAQCGPMIVDSNEIPDKFMCTLNKVSFNESRLEKLVFGFLNNNKNKMMSARLIEPVDALEQFKDLGAHLLGIINSAI